MKWRVFALAMMFIISPTLLEPCADWWESVYFVLHQHPDYPYIVYNDLPKLEHLKKEFPELLKKK